jgi:hypothetical protein
MWIGRVELVRLRVVFFRHMRLLLKTSFLLELLGVRLKVLGCGGVHRNRGCIPLLLGHPMNGLELCRRGVSGCTHDCIRAGVMGGPNAGMMMSTNYDPYE